MILRPPCGAFYRTLGSPTIISSLPAALSKIDTHRSFAKPQSRACRRAGLPKTSIKFSQHSSRMRLVKGLRKCSGCQPPALVMRLWQWKWRYRSFCAAMPISSLCPRAPPQLLLLPGVGSNRFRSSRFRRCSFGAWQFICTSPSIRVLWNRPPSRSAKLPRNDPRVSRSTYLRQPLLITNIRLKVARRETE